MLAVVKQPLTRFMPESALLFPTLPKTIMSTNDSGDGRGPWRTYVCVVCGYIYDEAAGCPAEGIAPGTRWEDVPDWWTCPECGVGKADFDMIEAG